MGKAARIKRERAAGTRKPNGQYWNEIKPGFKLVVPTLSLVDRGATPQLVPTSLAYRMKQTKRKPAVEAMLSQYMKPQISGTAKR